MNHTTEPTPCEGAFWEAGKRLIGEYHESRAAECYEAICSSCKRPAADHPHSHPRA